MRRRSKERHVNLEETRKTQLCLKDRAWGGSWQACRSRRLFQDPGCLTPPCRPCVGMCGFQAGSGAGRFPLRKTTLSGVEKGPSGMGRSSQKRQPSCTGLEWGRFGPGGGLAVEGEGQQEQSPISRLGQLVGGMRGRWTSSFRAPESDSLKEYRSERRSRTQNYDWR